MLQILALAGGKPLLPEMLFPTVNKFNPRNVPLNPALSETPLLLVCSSFGMPNGSNRASLAEE